MTRFRHGDPDVVVRDVLAQAAYRHAYATTQTAPQKSPFAIAWEWFVRHVLAPIFGQIGRALEGRPSLGTAIGIAAIVLAVAAIGFVAYRFVAGAARSRALEPASGHDVPLATARDAAAWLAFARAAADGGDYATAIAALFAAALARLDERAIVAFDPARTPGEYRRAVRRERARAADPFDDLAAAFVRARFAAPAPDRDAFGVAARAYERFAPEIGA